MRRKIVNGPRMMRTLVLAFGLAIAGPSWGGDAAAGSRKVEVCTACHAADGNSVIPAYPKLAGQGERYLLRQLRAIKRGDWNIPLMAGQLDTMSDQDLQDIAAFYADGRMSPGATDPDLLQHGQQIYRAGIAARGVPACMACHSPTGAGNAPAGYPHLAGQHAEYILERLEQYRDGKAEYERPYDETARIMSDVTAGMLYNDMKAVASYIQGLR